MKRQGFTLIELLVVIAIIGLLSTLAVVALGSARVKVRDTKRLSDLTQLRSVLELYYADHNEYPAGSGIELGTGSAMCLNTNGFMDSAGCDNPYMPKVPAGPQDNEYYVYTVSTSSYSITASLEDAMDGLSGDIVLTPSGITQAQ